jgi:hypothetical protein
MKKKQQEERSIPEAYFDAAVATVGVVGGALATALLWQVANRIVSRLLDTPKES